MERKNRPLLAIATLAVLAISSFGEAHADRSVVIDGVAYTWSTNDDYYSSPENAAALVHVARDTPQAMAGHYLEYTRGTDGSINVVCENGTYLSLVPLGGGPTSAPPPPPPVVTTSTSSQSCSYIASWAPNWSDCRFQGEWAANATASCVQRNDWSANYANASWTCTTTYVDGVASGASCAGSCPSSASRPAAQSETKQVSLSLPDSTQCIGQYANGSDRCTIGVQIVAPTNQNRAITGLTGKRVKNVRDLTRQPSDALGWTFDSTTGNALDFSAVPEPAILQNGKQTYFLIEGIRAVTPFENTNGRLSFELPGSTSYSSVGYSGILYSFRKPFVGKLEASENGGASWSALPKVGTSMDYRLKPVARRALSEPFPSGYGIADFSGKVSVTWADVSLQSLKVRSETLGDRNGVAFSARVDTSSSAKKVAGAPWIQVDRPEISYVLSGRNVRYWLSGGDAPNDRTPVALSGSNFTGVRIVGSAQLSGKSVATGQAENFSEIGTSARSTLRKNAFQLIRNMNSGQVVNGVRYVVGDVTVSGDQDYETLVVVDGNVIVNGNLNPTGRKFAIIVLKDGYDPVGGYVGKGNVLVTPQVTKINAIMYADGAMVSADANGKAFVNDGPSRTAALQKQLSIVGSLMTRNTVGGAVLAGGSYLLPWRTRTNDFDAALAYDLNYFRRGSLGCDANGNGNCTDAGEYPDPLVITYDPRTLTDPPKGFLLR